MKEKNKYSSLANYYLLTTFCYSFSIFFSSKIITQIVVAVEIALYIHKNYIQLFLIAILVWNNDDNLFFLNEQEMFITKKIMKKRRLKENARIRGRRDHTTTVYGYFFCFF
jgi:hypothetical protein